MLLCISNPFLSGRFEPVSSLRRRAALTHASSSFSSKRLESPSIGETILNAEQRNWLDKAVGGDKDALGELLASIGPDVEAALYISPTWGGLLETADVMQVTYLEAFLQIRKFDPARADAFPTWLRRMAENNLRDAIRGLEAKKNPSPRMQLEAYGGNSSLALFDVLTAGTGTPSRAVRGEETAERVRQAVGLLPPDYQRTIQLYDLDGRPVQEVAEALGRSTGAVYMLRMRAHDRLRELLCGGEHLFESRT